ncbi:MAG: substrate-binding domain-containing protein, partial [Alicyclobacillus shizuokensis]|nr:substrate-binding domain-containing protein [Alicyclobacillus shizuokensis]
MRKYLMGVMTLGLVLVSGCGTAANSGNSASQGSGQTSSQAKTVTLTFGSYSTTKQVYENQIFPAFQKYWRAKTGQNVKFDASFDASGAEARSIVNGLPVDVAALSLADDIDKIQQAGLITHNWQADKYHGMVTDSIVAIGVRKGNPKHIQSW